MRRLGTGEAAIAIPGAPTQGVRHASGLPINIGSPGSAPFTSCSPRPLVLPDRIALRCWVRLPMRDDPYVLNDPMSQGLRGAVVVRSRFVTCIALAFERARATSVPTSRRR